MSSSHGLLALCSWHKASHSVHRNLFHVLLSFRKQRVSQVERRVLRNCKQLYDFCLVIDRRKVATPNICSVESVNKVLSGKPRPLQFVMNAFFSKLTRWLRTGSTLKHLDKTFMKVALEKKLFLRTLDLSHWFILTRMVPDVHLST